MASLAAKLQIKVGGSLGFINIPPGYLAFLESNLDGIRISKSGKLDGILIFVNDLAEVRRFALPRFVKSVESSLVWIAYPKGGKTDVNRDTLRAAVFPTGWSPVRLVALDEVWSAMRFRPARAEETE